MLRSSCLVPRLHRGLRLAAVLALLPLAGCYRDLDYSKIKCDVNKTPACPDGYVCGANGLCAPVAAPVDAPVADTALPGTPDTSALDTGSTTPLDGSEADTTVVTPADTGAPLDTAVDVGGKDTAVPGEAGADAPPDAGADVPLDTGPDAPPAGPETGDLDLP
jgi:hypothetical protein